jgi:fermentation-respiration switch protein FrsA (DUF1100 family)
MKKAGPGWGEVFLISFLVTIGCSCSSLLYHPTQQVYFAPEQAQLKYDNVSFKSADGAMLYGWHLKAEGGRTPKALIVHFHGNAENLTSHFATLAWAMSQGYDSFIFDYQGYGKSEGKPTPAGTVQDGIAALRIAPTLVKAGTPIVVFGQSLGGAISLRSLIEVKAQDGEELSKKIPVRLIVIDSSFKSYKDAGQGVMSRSWITWLFQPLAHLLLSDEWAPDDRVKELSPIPIVVMHGDQDQVVNLGLGEELYAAAGDPKEFWKIEQGRHTDAFWRHGTKYRERFIERIEKALENEKKR